jgi:hypothetical protein
MTRDFNKPTGNDPRPSFRNKSSNKPGEERSSRPARPRLNRETVDRAWESGAQTQHHDYRPRTSNNGQPTRNGQPQRNNRYSDHSSTSYNNHSNSDRPYDNRSYGNRTDGNRPPYGNRTEGSRPPYGNRAEGGRPYNNRYEGRNEDRPPYGGRPDNNRSYGSRPGSGRPPYGNRYEDNRSEGRPPYRTNRYEGGNRYEGNRPEGGRPSYGNRYEGNRYEGNRSEGGRPSYGNRREYDRDGNQGPRSYGEQRNPNFRSNDQGDQPRDRRDNFRGNDRGYQPRYGNDRPNDREFRRDEPRPFRPGRRDSFQEEPRQPFARGRYEGDYEGLDEKTPPRQAPYARNSGPGPRHNEAEPVEERHVTRMPDGRVLKGPRPAQRKNERFWQGVADDTETLVGQVHVPDNEDEVEAEEQLLTTLEHLTEETPEDLVAVDGLSEEEEGDAPAEPAEVTPQPERKSRARGAASRAEKEKKPRGIVPKPSQRGFKWPTP